MLFGFRCLRRRLIGLHDFSELRAKSANHGQLFAAKRAASRANVDELDDGNKVVDVDGGFRCIGHGSIIWIRERRHVGEGFVAPQLDLR